MGMASKNGKDLRLKADESINSRLIVPHGNALPITGTFLDEISHDIPHQNWGEKEWDLDFRYMKAMGIDTVIDIRCGYRKFITYPSPYLLKKGCYMPSTDMIDMFCRLAQKYGMKFWLGPYDSGKYWDTRRHVIRGRGEQVRDRRDLAALRQQVRQLRRLVHQRRDQPCHQGRDRVLPHDGAPVQGRSRADCRPSSPRGSTARRR